MTRRLPLLALLLLACGRDTTGPTPLPTPTPPAPLSAIDGITGAVVSAAITTGGVTTASAPGYLLRETVQRGGVLTLWPTAPTAGYQMSEDYIRQVVYGRTGAWSDRLARWDGPMVLGLGPGLSARPGAVARLDYVVDELAKLPWVSVRRTDVLAEATVVYDLGDPGNPSSVAIARIRSRGWTFVSAELVFRTAAWYLGGSAAMHEIGHVLGLYHSPAREDVMFAFSSRRGSPGYTGNETALLAMMYAHRRPGNAWPDRDTDLGALSGVERTLIISCE